MASNYSVYKPQNNQSPQYVYFTPNLARHPNSPSYYYASAVPMQAVPVEKLHPRSHSFNDLYTGQYHQQSHASGAPSISSNQSLSYASAVSTSTPPTADQHLITHTRPMPKTPTTINQSVAPGTPPLATSGAKPLRYRGRMARSKSYSSLVAPNPPPTTNAPANIPTESHGNGLLTTGNAGLSSSSHAGGLPSHGRRMSSTSSLHGHTNYSASMSSTEGSSTPSIMSTADTDSMTTQTSVSSTSSVDDEAKIQKLNYARRRNVANNTNTLLENTTDPVEHRNESEKEPQLQDSGHILKDAATVTATATTPEPILAVNADKDEKDNISSQKGYTTEMGGDTETQSRNASSPPAKDTSPATTFSENSSKEFIKNDSDETGSMSPSTADLSNHSELAHSAGTETSDAVSSKAPVSKTAMKHNQPQASEASQAREASVKPARVAKETLPSRETNSDNNTDLDNEEVDPKAIKPKSDVHIAASHTPQHSQAKRATAASPSKLVLPSDLQPRSYYQTTSASGSRDSLVVARQARSYSWYPGLSEPSGSPDSMPVLSATSESLDPIHNMRPRTPSTQSETSYMRPRTPSTQSETSSMRPRVPSTQSETFSMRPRTPSTQSETSSMRPRTHSIQSETSSMKPRTTSQGSESSDSSNPVFLRRAYASRQRQSVQSLPPRRPESFYSPVKPNAHHPLPREPSSSSSTSQKSAQKPQSHFSPTTAVTSTETSAPASPTSKGNTSRSFGSRLRNILLKGKSSEQSTDDVSDTVSIASTRSSKSSMSIRSSSSSFSSFSNHFRRKKGNAVNNIEIPAPPAPAMTRQNMGGSVTRPLSNPTLKTWSATPSPTEPEAPRPPSPALGSIGRQVAPNLTAGDIYPGLLRPNEVDTIISSLERTGSFERKLSTSRRSKEQKVPDERVIRAPEPVNSSSPTHNPLKSALKRSGGRSESVSARRISFAKNTLVYNTYSAADYNRTPEPLPYDFRDRRVVIQLYRELNDLKLSMPVHPSSKHHTQYLFDRDVRHIRTPPS